MKWTLVIFSVVLHSVLSATNDDTSGWEDRWEKEALAEAKANRVEVAIYQLSKAKWDDGVGKEFIDMVLEGANTKCSVTPKDCGLIKWNETLDHDHLSFRATDFEMADGSPSYKKPYLNVSYSLKFPTSVVKGDYPETKYYLKKSALLDISKNMQPKLLEKTGYRILKMDFDTFIMPPNQNLNIIMCVVAIVLFAICVILIFVLRYTCSHAHKPEPVVKVTVDPPENKEASSKDGLQNTGV